MTDSEAATLAMSHTLKRSGTISRSAGAGATVIEITVDKLTYSGSRDVYDAIDTKMGMRDLSHLRMDTHIDGIDHRDPFIVTMVPWQIDNDFDVGRIWPMSQQIDFALWAVPVSNVTGVNVYAPPPPPFYQANEILIGKASLTQSTSSPVDLAFNGDLKLHFTPANGPEANRVDGQVKYPSKVNSAILDFKSATDNGSTFIDKGAVETVMEALGSRLDQTGAIGQPDSYPDGPVDAADQNHRGFCAGAALLFNYALNYPRRAVELCRSLYQPMARHDPSGSFDHGYLTWSNTATIRRQYVRHFYDGQQVSMGRSPEAAFIDLIQFSFQETLNQIHPFWPQIKAKPNTSPGMNVVESEAMMQELMPLVGTNTSGYQPQLGRGGVRPLRRAQTAIDNDNMNMISIDATLVNPKLSLSKNPAIDHVITLLDSNAPALNVSRGVPDLITITFQNPWGGQAAQQTHPKADINSHVFNVTVGKL